MKKHGRRHALALLGVALTSACTPGWNSAMRRPPVRPADRIRTDPSAMGRCTLVVWDQEVRGGQNRQISELNRRFQSRYPNIQINRVARSFEDLRNTTKLALTGQQPPDVVQVNNGKQDMGAFVRAGLLLPLDGYAEAYRWSARFPEPVLRFTRYNDAGNTLGQGHLYGLPQTGELVGIYYNRNKLRSLDLQVPRSWSAFDAALRRAQQAGELPMQFGNLEKSSGIHLFGVAQNRYVPAAAVYQLATGAQGATWQDSANLSAAELVRRWSRRGYLTPGFAGVDEDSAWRAFADGQGVYHISGTWLLADLQAAMGDSVGFTTPPSNGGSATVTGGTGVPFAISANTENPDASAAYLDFITSSEAMEVLLAQDNLPVLPVRERPEKSLSRQISRAWRSASTSGGLVPYLDYATATAYDTVTDATQRLLAGDLSPAEFLRRMAKDLENAG